MSKISKLSQNLVQYQKISRRNCCDFIISDCNKIGMVGRTMEFGIPVYPEISIQQKGKEFDYCGLVKKNCFGYLQTKGAVKIEGEDLKVLCDGHNEKGLSCDLLYLPRSCEWPSLETVPNLSNAIRCKNIGDFILGNCSSVDEVKEALNDYSIWGSDEDNKVYTFHYQVFEKSGKGLIIEYIKGNKCLHESIGVMTNEPPYSYHVSNMRQYLHLSNEVSEYVSCNENGLGTGLVGLPGDPTPPSRFVRCKISKDFIEKDFMPKTREEAVITVNHIINSVDITKGMAKEDDGFDHTQWATIKDLYNLEMYFRGYYDLGWTMYDLKEDLPNIPEGECKVLKEIKRVDGKPLKLAN